MKYIDVCDDIFLKCGWKWKGIKLFLSDLVERNFK